MYSKIEDTYRTIFSLKQKIVFYNYYLYDFLIFRIP